MLINTDFSRRASLNDGSVQAIPIIAQTCAITFQGNATNQLQQDAFFLLDDWYQEALGVTAIMPVKWPFCVAVSDGVASSTYSQRCSKAVVKAIKSLWRDQRPLTTDNIHHHLNQKNHPSKYHGAAATLAIVVGEMTENGSVRVTIMHVGDSRVYVLRKAAKQWQCLTRDHNLLNELVDEQAKEKGRQADFSDYNQEGMGGSLYSITECFALNADNSGLSSEAPESTSRNIEIQSGDCMVVCTDGIHDLVPSHEWQLIDAKTNLQEWLIALKNQVYDSEGNAYDNGTAIVVQFE